MKKNPFLVGVATLMAGSALSQLIPVAISPILTRVYSPFDFGLFSLFLSITAVLGTVACGRYELAVMLPDDEEDARGLAVLGIAIAAFMSFLLFLVLLGFSSQIAALLGIESRRSWLFWAPPVVLFLGVFNSLNYLSTRNGLYGRVARAQMARATSGSALQVALGLAVPGPLGLVAGYTAGTMTGNISLARPHLRGEVRVSRSLLWRLARRYSDFPRYSVPSALAQTVSLAAVSVIIARSYSVAVLGEFALVQRALGLPVALIAGSVGQVFFRQASIAKRETGSFQAVFRTTFRWLALVAVTTTILLYVILPTGFDLVFGEEWGSAGELARNMLPGFAMQFVVAPLSLSNQVNMRNRFGLVGNVAALVIMCTTLLTAVALEKRAAEALLWMSTAQACYYLIFLILIWRHVKAASTESR